MTTHRDHPSGPDVPGAGLRERVALSCLRTAADLAPEREATFARIAAHPPGMSRDRALGDLAASAWTEKALMWLGWRLLPGDVLGERLSASAS